MFPLYKMYAELEIRMAGIQKYLFFKVKRAIIIAV